MTEKVRVHEIAKELGIASKDVLKKASKINIEVESAQSTVTMEQAEFLMNYIMDGTLDSDTSISQHVQKQNKIFVRISKLLKETGLSKNNIILKAKELGITINKQTQQIDENSYNKIVDYVANKEINKITRNKIKFSKDSISYKFNYKNILLKGVPGTGKSRAIDNIITKKLNISKKENILRINIHSASSNADLMQGIGINSNNGKIEYKEKQGLVLNFIQKAIFTPFQPFALILEEIQENSLNELIGDLIYLIEDSKRAKSIEPDNKFYTYDELVEKCIQSNNETSFVKMPNLVNHENSYKKMLLPDNLYIFCTSNYRDDKKIIEDNLLRRFDVIEIYPKYKSELKDDFKNQDISNFLEELNNSIIDICQNNGEIHPDRFMIGHSILLKVDNEKDFNRAFLKIITEFKDIKDFHFEDFKRITENLVFPFGLKNNYINYQEWIKDLQRNCYDFMD